MDFECEFEKLQNGIETFNIKDPSEFTSRLVVAIKRGSNDDPVVYGGSYHYLEHMLGSYFEYSKYGSNYDHLSMMNGTTLSTYLFIYKRFIFDESTINTLVDNLCKFIRVPEMDKNILENEKWMVNNETTSKLYDYPLMNLLSIFEQIQTGRPVSTHGRLHSLNEQVLNELKRILVGADYVIFFVNIPDSSVKRQCRELNKIKFNKYKSTISESLSTPINVKTVRGKNILLVNSIYNVSCMIITNVEPAILLYMQCTGNDVFEVIWNNRPFAFQTYNDILICYTSEMSLLSQNDDDILKIYTEAYIQFLYKLLKASISESVMFFINFYLNIVTNPIYYNLVQKFKLSSSINKSVYKTEIYEDRKCKFTTNISEMIGDGTKKKSKIVEYMDMFIETFEPKFPTDIDFVLARMTNAPNSFDKYNTDTNMYYSFSKYNKKLNVDIHKLSITMNSDLLLTINIDYNTGIIYSNAIVYNSRTTFLCIELDLSDQLDIGFLIFYNLAGCMPYYYTVFDNKKMIMSCTYQSEKNIIESNLREMRYSDIYQLALKIQSGNYDIMNSKNTFFYLITTCMQKINLNKIFEKQNEKIFNVRNRFSVHILNYSKLVTTEIPVKMSPMLSRNKLDIKSLKLLKHDYLLIYNECDDIILTQIFIQYIYTLLHKLSRKRRIYMGNVRVGFDSGFYIILINVQVKNIKDEIIQLYDSLNDKLTDVGFDVDVGSIIVNIIKLMLYYNMEHFRSQFDIYSLDVIKEFIENQIHNMRIIWK